MLFLKAFSWGTDLQVTLDDFALKTQNLEVKIKLVETKFAVRAEDNHNCISNMCEKEFSDSSYRQNIDFSRNCPKFHTFTKIINFQV